MGHHCVDWSATSPVRKVHFLVLSHGDRHWYVAVPKTFSGLEELARVKFDLARDELEFYSSCVNICGDALARIDQDVWEHVAPYIGCLTVKQKETYTRSIADTEIQTDNIEIISIEDIFDVQSSSFSSRLTTEDSDSDGREEITRLSHGTQSLNPPCSSSEVVRNTGEHVIEYHPRSISASSRDDTLPLRRSPNSWIAPSLDCLASMKHLRSSDHAKRRFTGLPNKLTTKNVVRICDSMISWIDGCHSTARGQVLKLAIKLIFDRAVDGPERMRIYVGLIEILFMRIGADTEGSRQSFEQSVDGAGEAGYAIIRSTLEKHLRDALQHKYLSWGDTVRNPVVIRAGTEYPIDEFYAAEKAKRCGIGLAGLLVELVRLGLFALQGHAYDEDFLQELRQNLENGPKEGDIVSLSILIRNINPKDAYWYSWRKVHDQNLGTSTWAYCNYRGACSSACEKLAYTKAGSNGVSPRIRCRLLYLRDLSHIRPQPKHRWLTYHSPHDELRYSVPEVSSWCTAQFVASPHSQIDERLFALVPSSDHWWFVRLLLTSPCHNNASSMGELLGRVLTKGLCSREMVEEGFVAAIHFWDATAKDGGQVYKAMAKILQGTGFDKEELTVMRIGKEARHTEKLVQLTLW